LKQQMDITRLYYIMSVTNQGGTTMKRIILVLSSITLLFGLIACSSDNQTMNDEKQLEETTEVLKKVQAQEVSEEEQKDIENLEKRHLQMFWKNIPI